VQCQTKFVASLEHSSLSRCVDLTSGTVHLLANRVLTLSCFLIWSALGGKLRHDDVNLDLSNAWRFCTFLPSPSSSLSLSTGAVGSKGMQVSPLLCCLPLLCHAMQHDCLHNLDIHHHCLHNLDMHHHCLHNLDMHYHCLHSLDMHHHCLHTSLYSPHYYQRPVTCEAVT